MMILSVSNKIFFTTQILNWGSDNLRSFPWRINPNVYKAFISEFFLQRTKASQIIESYNKFIQIFPNINALLLYKGDFTDFFKKLGLIKRATFLKNAINSIRNNEKSFRDFKIADFLKLSGIGKYSAHAIICFGKNIKLPLVDSNIIRIFKRFFFLTNDNKNHKYDPIFWNLAERLLPEKNFKKYNYSLIDFGAIICKPLNPHCSICKLKENCYNFLNHINQ
ncbi:hypothetical protein DSAG12_03016 [Promethearchaeum syntrophicum]|uniref:HhH-GPD domain-containing protein n=1 Tax=Promethearchaeum syntrophicum TaxID=2594042 RepID=A0A5B9DDI6_9ARCH|nr:hypothetical protein [Candidatus Prometheoarchaeum syntrophicum]QEE17184.1 G/T mismatches repair enzyme [Candidatus Prometheoarchaeum syntrophicum]